MTPRCVVRIPGIEISSAEEPPSRCVTLVLGGRAPDPQWLEEFAAGEIWAVDRGVDACRKAGIAPSMVIGDHDSAADEDWSWAVRNGAVEDLHPRDKDSTDFQIAMDMLRDSKAGVLVTGCMGGRLDHILSNVSTFAWWADGCRPLCMADDREGLFLMRGPARAEAFFERGVDGIETVSLISLSDYCTGVSISGVAWPLDEVVLDRRRIWSVSNRLAETEDGTKKTVAKLSCASGTLALYWAERNAADDFVGF